MNQELLDKIQELENKLKWRDAEKCPPTHEYLSENHIPTIEFLVIVEPYVVSLFCGEYNPEEKKYFSDRGFPITGGMKVACWRPFDYPNYGSWVGGCYEDIYKKNKKEKNI